MCHSSELVYLPPEVWRQILANLSVQTLLRFRSVCKSWCSFIDHSDFIYTHLACRKVDSNKTTIFALERMGNHGNTKGCLLTVCRGNTHNKFPHSFECFGIYFVIGRCNELVLMRRYVRTGYNPNVYRKELILCNPCIRKSLLIPPCPISDFMYLLGFAPRTKDYKLVAISARLNQGNEPTKTSVAVYTLSDQQWSVRNNDVDFSCLDIKRMYVSANHAPDTIYFQGAAHWVGKSHLVSFNFDSEKITVMEIPNALTDEQESIRKFFLLGNSLAIFSISLERSEIWVMEQGQGNEVWTKWFSGPSNCDAFDLFKPLRWPPFNVIYYESDDGRCLIWGNKLYNIDTCQVKAFEKSMSGCSDLGMYMESLVLFKVDGVEDMTFHHKLGNITAMEHHLCMILGRMGAGKRRIICESHFC